MTEINANVLSGHPFSGTIRGTYQPGFGFQPLGGKLPHFKQNKYQYVDMGKLNDTNATWHSSDCPRQRRMAAILLIYWH